MAVSEEAVKEEVGSSVSDEVEIEWTPENEVHLFYALRGHKPVGIGKYFQMACIVEKFRNFANKDVTSKPLWEHLESMYDIQSLDDIENMPFPNEERDFCLPEEEFGNLIQERTKSERRQVETGEEDSNKLIKEVIVKMSPARKEVNKEPKKSANKESKEIKKEVKGKDVTKEGKKDSAESKEPKTPKQRAGKEKEEEAAAAKRGGKRSARGGSKSDDASSNQSSSPVATPTPLPPLPSQKRRRT